MWCGSFVSNGSRLWCTRCPSVCKRWQEKRVLLWACVPRKEVLPGIPSSSSSFPFYPWKMRQGLYIALVLGFILYLDKNLLNHYWILSLVFFCLSFICIFLFFPFVMIFLTLIILYDISKSDMKIALNNRRLTPKTKVLIYQTHELSTLLNGSETWIKYSCNEYKKPPKKSVNIKCQNNVTNFEALYIYIDKIQQQIKKDDM